MTDSQRIIQVQDIEIAILNVNGYISLTDIARNKNANEPKDIVKNWMRFRSTVEFLGIWEQLNNASFKGVEFDPLLFEAGSNSFTLSPSKWIELTNAKGIVSKAGKNGGTFAHKDIAFEFASWINPVFKLYLITEFQRLKETENTKLNLEWNLQHTLAKVNYRIHTDAIKDEIIPSMLTKEQASFVSANEADMLNVALFAKTAQQWRSKNPDKALHIVKVLKKTAKPKQKLSEKFAGSLNLTDEEYNNFQASVSQSRNEWERI